jgi:uncharacterized NAD(P)/FAD-binding protein YdhS
VNCTGVGADLFLNRMIADAMAIPDPLGHAIGVNTELKVIRPNRQAWNNLWMLGPATMGSLGDVVAASAISKQAEELASQIQATTNF